MTQKFQKCTLQDAISKIIWSTYQIKTECSPLEIHFKRKPKTI